MLFSTCLLWVLASGCGDDEGKTSTDAGRDARLSETDEDAGTPSELSSSCGLPNEQPVAFYQNSTRVFPGTTTAGPAEQGAHVIATGQGVPLSLRDSGVYPQDRNYTFIALAKDEQTWTIVARDVSSFGVAPGDVVTLRWEHRQTAFYRPPTTKLTLHVGERLAFSYSVATDLPEGFSVEPGEEQCRGTDGCAEWVSEALIVHGPCGEQVAVASGERGWVCGYEVLPGTLVRVLRQVKRCSDWWVKGTELTLAGSGARD